jgi:hypothetical protein
MDSPEADSFMADKDPSDQTPREFLFEFDRLALGSRDFAGIIDELEKLRPGREWRLALDYLVNSGGLDRLTAWAVMLSWLADKLTNDLSLSRQAKRILRRALGALADSRRKRRKSIWAEVESHFSSLTAESWC